jgi:hypothetical protein
MALSNFYREEFLKHLEHLQSTGAVAEHAAADRACRLVMTRLERVCGSEAVPAVAETLLRQFDALSGLSAFDPRKRH